MFHFASGRRDQWQPVSAPADKRSCSNLVDSKTSFSYTHRPWCSVSRANAGSLRICRLVFGVKSEMRLTSELQRAAGPLSGSVAGCRFCSEPLSGAYPTSNCATATYTAAGRYLRYSSSLPATLDSNSNPFFSYTHRPWCSVSQADGRSVRVF
jgi:hypothetical protein